MRLAAFFALSLSALTVTACSTIDSSNYAETSTVAESVPQSSLTVTEVAGVDMLSNRTIFENGAKSPVHKTLVKWIMSAGLVDTLNSEGPFTVFAPTDNAFAAVPKNVTNFLVKRVNRASMIKLLNYHIVPGRITYGDLANRIKAGDGRATLTTLAGQKLAFTQVNKSIKIDGMSGSTGYIAIPDVIQSNGIIHVINGVLVPDWP